MLVHAAREGDLARVVEAVHLASSVDAAVRVQPEGRPATALHMAAHHGHTEIVELLLAAGADPCVRMATLKALTPLHVAKDATTCRMLLDAGAAPIAVDPRQPDPGTYLRSQRRTEVSRAIGRARAAACPYPFLLHQLLGALVALRGFPPRAPPAGR